MRYAELNTDSFIINFIELPFEPDGSSRITFVQSTGDESVGDYYNGSSFIDIKSHPSTISTITLSSNSIDSITISSIPNPSTITIDGSTYEVTDGDLEFTTDFPGAYTIKIESFPYLPKEFVVTAS